MYTFKNLTGSSFGWPGAQNVAIPDVLDHEIYKHAQTIIITVPNQWTGTKDLKAFKNSVKTCLKLTFPKSQYFVRRSACFKADLNVRQEVKKPLNSWLKLKISHPGKHLKMCFGWNSLGFIVFLQQLKSKLSSRLEGSARGRFFSFLGSAIFLTYSEPNEFEALKMCVQKEQILNFAGDV